MLPLLLLAFAQAPDLILHNAKILTVDARNSTAQAMAIRGDRIVSVGTSAKILSLKGPKTQILDAKGKTVLPGLIDSHTHSLDASMFEFDHEIPSMASVEDVLNHIRNRTQIVPEGEWISLRQIFITRLKEQRYPTKTELDEAAPKHPVIFSTGPDASLNTLALKANNITKDTRSPAGQPGKVELDAKTGQPSGILRTYAAFVKDVPSGRQPTDEDRRNRLKLLMADYNSIGITSFTERAATPRHIDIYRQLRQRNELTTRIFLDYHITNPNGDWPAIEAEIEAASKDPLHTYDNMLWLRGLKVFLDGGMLTGSALMREPWGTSEIYSITDPNYRGMRYINQQRLTDLARASLKRDLQFTAHAVGDGAVQSLIAAYEEVNKEFPVRAGRPCLTHANFMTPEGIEKMAQIGIVADMQPAWLELDGATLIKHFGLPRLRFFQPYATLFKNNIIIGGGSDHMQKIGGMRATNPYNPFWGMWVAITRKPRWTDQILHPSESITRTQALRLYTINNAYLSFEEKQKGSLEAGKLADFIVIDRDILRCPTDQIKEIQVEATYLGGRLIYSTPVRK